MSVWRKHRFMDIVFVQWVWELLVSHLRVVALDNGYVYPIVLP